jgi:hypothetical protein
MTRYLLDTNAMGDSIDHRKGVDATAGIKSMLG